MDATVIKFIILVAVAFYLLIGVVFALLSLMDPEGRGTELFFKLIVAWPYFRRRL